MDGSGIIEECKEEMITFIFKKEKLVMIKIYGRRASSLSISHSSPKRSREYCSLKGDKHRDIVERVCHIKKNLLAAQAHLY